MTALGMIETKGLLTAIEGADAMLKAADVRLLEKHLASGGLVTITVAGEVSAVRAAVDAGVSAIRRINEASLVSDHVIARPDSSLDCVVALSPKQPEVVAPQTPVQEEAVQAQPEADSAEAVQPEQVAEESAEAVETAPVATPEPLAESAAKVEQVRYEISQLKKMNVSKLRQIARGISNLSIAREAVKSANKKDLIEAIINSYRQIEE